MMQKRTVTEVKPDPQAQELPFHLKYRPQSLKDVLGQDAVVDSLAKLKKEKTRPHAFLFVGPSGTGKTTLARILAKDFDCDPRNLLEADAASNSGIDAMREIMRTLQYLGFDGRNRAIIIDECHALSKQAWQSLLKTVEEPPEHVYLFFCTTEAGKVPEAILTRCHSYTLKPLKFDPLMDLLEHVAKQEDLATDSKILETVARSCNGSPRQALVMLSQVRDCEDSQEAAALLESPMESKEVIDLCRALIAGKLDWSTLTKTLKAMPDMSAESIRIVIQNYLAGCAMNARGDKEAVRILGIMDCFNRPFPTTDKLAPLLLAFGDYIFE